MHSKSPAFKMHPTPHPGARDSDAAEATAARLLLMDPELCLHLLFGIYRACQLLRIFLHQNL
jgi:hypothetical protein